MRQAKTTTGSGNRVYTPTEEELELAEDYIYSYDFIIEDEEKAKQFYDLQVKQYEDTIRYEQKHKKRRK